VFFRKEERVRYIPVDPDYYYGIKITLLVFKLLSRPFSDRYIYRRKKRPKATVLYISFNTIHFEVDPQIKRTETEKYILLKALVPVSRRASEIRLALSLASYYG
jgi:hypothetical protein